MARFGGPGVTGLSCSIGNSRYDAPYTDLFPEGTWTHVACTDDGTTLRIFIAGVERQTVSVSGGTGPVHPSIYVGRSQDGTIDEVRVWNVATSSSELVGTMYTQLVGNEPGLAGYWRFNEGAGQVVTDASPNHCDGYLGTSPDVDAIDPTWSSDAPF